MIEMLRAEDVGYAYSNRSSAFALESVSLEFAPGRMHFICGPSGSGKSTLAMLLAGLANPDSGRVLWGNTPAGDCLSQIACVFQFPERLFIEDTVWEEIVATSVSCDLEQVKELFAAVDINFGQLREMHPFHLSASVGRLLSILLQMMRKPRVLILDEPTIGLDWVYHRKLTDLLRNWLTAERICIVVTHDLRLLTEFDGTATVLAGGRVGWAGETRELLFDQARLSDLDLA